MKKNIFAQAKKVYSKNMKIIESKMRMKNKFFKNNIDAVDKFCETWMGGGLKLLLLQVL